MTDDDIMRIEKETDVLTCYVGEPDHLISFAYKLLETAQEERRRKMARGNEVVYCNSCKHFDLWREHTPCTKIHFPRYVPHKGWTRQCSDWEAK
jgi:hypothetical protein